MINARSLHREICEMWPRSSIALSEKWAQAFIDVLDSFDGATLAAAWAKWKAHPTHPNAPQPGEIANVCRALKREEDRPVEGYSNDKWRMVRERRDRLVDEWEQANPRMLKAAEDEGWLWDLQREVRDRCHLAAQQDMNGKKRPVVRITDADVTAFRGRVKTRAWLKKCKAGRSPSPSVDEPQTQTA